MWMKGRLNKTNQETAWYENDAPVKEYLDKELSKKVDSHPKEPQTAKLSWLDIIKKKFPIE